MFFITQLAEKGNLHDVVTKECPPFKQRVQFMRDVARGKKKHSLTKFYLKEG